LNYISKYFFIDDILTYHKACLFMRILPLLLLGVLSLSTNNAAFASLTKEQKVLFFGHDRRQTLPQPDAKPWQAIGQVETASGNLCTATLISPRLALTAGHCVLAPPGVIDKAIMIRFVAVNERWRYHSNAIETLVDKHLGGRLKALIRLSKPFKNLTPLPLWQGERQDLIQALQQANRLVTQAGYPVDHLDTLYMHQNCQITGWAQPTVLSHRCDTLPGDSGSPLMLNTPQGWRLIAIQSSAPSAKDRYRADNRALAVTGIRSELLSLSGKTDSHGTPNAGNTAVPAVSAAAVR
jgi:protease YdgD